MEICQRRDKLSFRRSSKKLFYKIWGATRNRSHFLSGSLYFYKIDWAVPACRDRSDVCTPQSERHTRIYFCDVISKHSVISSTTPRTEDSLCRWCKMRVLYITYMA